jgi:hypothetical protein
MDSSDSRTKTIALRVTNKEFEQLKAIAQHLHSQKYYDSGDKTYKQILATTEPAGFNRTILGLKVHT